MEYFLTCYFNITPYCVKQQATKNTDKHSSVKMLDIEKLNQMTMREYILANYNTSCFWKQWRPYTTLVYKV